MVSPENMRLIEEVSITKVLVAGVAYGAEDVLSESATIGTPWEFADIVPARNVSARIVKAVVISETTAVVPALTLYLFSAAPTSNLNDNLANTALLHADLANFVGKINFPILEDLGGDSEALVTPSLALGNLPLAFRSTGISTSLFGVLVTRDAFTQVAGREMTIKLTAEVG